jgi:uncharacterized membrane protein
MRLILVLAGALALSAALAASAGATVVQYEVRGVKANDKLNVRAAPTHTARILGRIPPNGREIEIIARGRGQWVKISYGRLQGYVNRTFLARSKPRLAAAASAKAAAASDPNDEVYAGPTPSSTAEPVVPAAAAEPAAPAAPVEPAPAAALEMPAVKSTVEVDPTALEAPPAPPPVSAPAAVAPPVPSTPEKTAAITAPKAEAPAKLDAPTKPATSAPGEKRPDGASAGLMMPPDEFMNDPAEPVPSRLTCGGTEPSWTLTMGGGVTWFETPEGEKVQLPLKSLQTSAVRANAWTATGRSASSKLTMQLVKSGQCSMGAGSERSPYDVSLQMDDGRLMTGCCQAAAPE